MIKGTCIDDRDSLILIAGEDYFLFPNGENHFYVSKFPNVNAHTGCFEKSRFKEVEYELDKTNVYHANLIWRPDGYKSIELKKYYIVPKNTHAYFYRDRDLNQFCGCFPLHWFSDFEEMIHKIEIKNERERVRVHIEESEQLSFFD